MTTLVYKRLSELARIIPGYNEKGSRKKAGKSHRKYILIGAHNIKDGKLVDMNSKYDIEERKTEIFRRSIPLPGDIIVTTRGDPGKLYFYKKDDPPSIISNSCTIIRPAAGSNYLVSYLSSFEGRMDFQEKLMNGIRGSWPRKIYLAKLASIQIPVFNDPDSPPVTTENSQVHRTNLANMIKRGETAFIEFKSSLRWNVNAKQMDKKIENAVLKTIVAFCNSKGGDLLIGVSDDGEVIGVEQDGFTDTDKFLLHLGSLLQGRIIPNVDHLLDYKMIDYDGESICQVTCKPSKREVWLKPDKSSAEQFFIRSGPSSRELPPMKAIEYIKDHFRIRTANDEKLD